MHMSLYIVCSVGVYTVCVHRMDVSLLDLLFEYVDWGLVGFQLLILEEDSPLQLQRRRQVRVITEVTFKEEACHKAIPKHRLVGKIWNMINSK